MVAFFVIGTCLYNLGNILKILLNPLFYILLIISFGMMNYLQFSNNCFCYNLKKVTKIRLPYTSTYQKWTGLLRTSVR